jgi:hypothetical protein
MKKLVQWREWIKACLGDAGAHMPATDEIKLFLTRALPVVTIV